jgi:TolA-binding protein
MYPKNHLFFIDFPHSLITFKIVRGCSLFNREDFEMLALRLGIPSLVLTVLIGGTLIGSYYQDETKKDDPKDPQPKIKGTLPKGYKDLGLDEKQKQSIYHIEADYHAKIDELQQKIADLKKDEKAEIEKVLTKAQKDRLKEIREKELGTDTDPKPDPSKTDPKTPPKTDPPKTDPAKPDPTKDTPKDK